jgi:hypothetical protein
VATDDGPACPVRLAGYGIRAPKTPIPGGRTPVIDRTYPLSEAPRAIRYLQEGHARGKVAIIM